MVYLLAIHGKRARYAVDASKRHRHVWAFLQGVLPAYLRRRFAYRFEPLPITEPCLVVSNHVTNWDPFFVGLSVRHAPLFYVASEHLFRMGFLSKLINYLVAPIPRSKAASGASTVRACLRRLRAGDSICLFAEGDCSWDGRTRPVLPATGGFVRLMGVPLVTYRIEGGYLTLPRWSSKIRRGAMRGHAVHVYTPQELRAMTSDEVQAILNQDLFEDAWARQRTEPIAYRSNARAEHLERALFLCPACKRIRNFRTKGNALFCDCGLTATLDPYGFFENAYPFDTIAAWDAWQQAALHTMDKLPSFSDGTGTLSEVLSDHTAKRLETGALSMTPDALCCGTHSFPLARIVDMSMVKTHLLLFSCGGRYFEIRSKDATCLRKYLLAYLHAVSKDQPKEDTTPC